MIECSSCNKWYHTDSCIKVTKMHFMALYEMQRWIGWIQECILLLHTPVVCCPHTSAPHLWHTGFSGRWNVEVNNFRLDQTTRNRTAALYLATTVVILLWLGQLSYSFGEDSCLTITLGQRSYFCGEDSCPTISVRTAVLPFQWEQQS